MHIRNDPSFFLTNRTGAPHGDELGARATGAIASVASLHLSSVSMKVICAKKDRGHPCSRYFLALEARDDFKSSPLLPEVARSPTLKANDGIGICPLGSWVVVVTVVVVIVIAVVVVVICSCSAHLNIPWPVGQALAVSAFGIQDRNVEVTLGT
ncbi:hypothetical protein Tco_0127427 [Tanacetum coccineum]